MVASSPHRFNHSRIETAIPPLPWSPSADATPCRRCKATSRCGTYGDRFGVCTVQGFAWELVIDTPDGTPGHVFPLLGKDAATRCKECKPLALSPLLDGIPGELHKLNQWVGWRYDYDPKKEKWTKPPRDFTTGGRFASTASPSTWTNWRRAEKWRSPRGTYDGIGFVFPADRTLCGIDLDDCLDPVTGRLTPLAQEVVGELNTYCEVSPSGTGIKLIVRGPLPGPACKSPAIEFCDANAYFTLTGRRLPGTPPTIEANPEALQRIYAFHATRPPAAEILSTGGGGRGPCSEVSNGVSVEPSNEPCREPCNGSAGDAELIRRVLANRRAARLFEGDVSEFGGDHSRADLSLCGTLAFFTDGDRDRIDRLFRESKLYREKWDEKRGQGTYGSQTIDKALKGRPPKPSANGRKPAGTLTGERSYRFETISSKTFFQTNYKLDWLVKRMLVAGQPGILGGPRKALKTSTLADLAISLDTMTPFLGHFDVYRRRRVVFISGESGEAVLKETGRRICAARNIDPETLTVEWGFRLPQLASDIDREQLRVGLANLKADVVFIDPLYLCLLSGNDGRDIDAGNLFSMGPLLSDVARCCLISGATPILAVHSRKALMNPLEPMDLEDVAWSGIQEFARQWILVNPRERFNPDTGTHKLWLSAGGSAGQSGCWAVDVVEGVLDDDFSGRIWNVSVWLASDERDFTAEDRERKKAERERANDLKDGTKVLEAVDQLANEDGVAICNDVRSLLRWSGDKIKHVVLVLVRDGYLEKVETAVLVGKNKKTARPTDGIRRLKQ